MLWLILAVVWVVVWGGLGAYMSSQKLRPAAEGILFGVLLGPIGLILAALLPTGEPPKTFSPPSRPVRVDEFADPMDDDEALGYLADK